MRINDRGPFARSRVIDLSRTAAQELDIVRNGTARVRIEQLQAESLAVKDVAISGGGPAEQHAAVAQVSSGRYAPAQPGRQTAASDGRLRAAAGRAGAGVRAACAHPAGMAGQSAQRGRRAGTAYAPAGKRRADRGLARQRHDAAAGRAASMCRPAPSRRRRTPNASAAPCSSYGASEISQASAGGRDVYRVRLGPYTTPDAAGIVADRLKRSGYGDARVVAN